MRLRGLPTIFLLLVSLSVVRTAAAESGEIPTVVLGLEAVDGAPDNLAADITDALRQRVAATRDYQLLQGKDLVEVKLVFACPDEAPACMSQAGKSLGASKLIFGNIKKSSIDTDAERWPGRQPRGGRELRGPTPSRNGVRTPAACVRWRRSGWPS